MSGASYVSAESILSDTWIRVQLGYLSVPLDLQIHLKKKFYLKTGVSLDYLVFVNKRWQELNWYSIYSDIIRNGQIDNQQFSELEEKEVISKEKENFSGFNATIRTGVGYEFSDRLGLELTYRRQIKKLYKKSRSTIDMSFLELGIRVKLKK